MVKPSTLAKRHRNGIDRKHISSSERITKVTEESREPIYRLVIHSDAWDRIFGELSSGRQQFAWGPIVRSYHPPYCDLIMQNLKFATEFPKGSNHSLIFDWGIIDSPTSENESQIMEKLSGSEVQPHQLLAYVKAGIGSDHERWIGAVKADGRLLQISQIRLVGPGMRTLGRSFRTSVAIGAKVPRSDRWSRIEGVLGRKPFAKFRRTPVLLIGAGRLASLLASSLIRNGLRELTIIDPDQLEDHNRDSTFGNFPSDIGKGKAGVLARYLHRVRPQARITAIERDVGDDDIMERFRRASVVFSCVDNDQARRIVAKRCAQLLLVHIDLGTLIRQTRLTSLEDRLLDHTGIKIDSNAAAEIVADVRLMLPGACLSCVGGLQASDSVSEHESDLWRSGGRIGSLTSLNHLAVGTAQQLYFDLLTEHLTTSFWQRIQWIQGTGLRTAGSAVSADDPCEICGR
jgi:molybdopterin/thiamine biosynthesis adenylyltransferase